MKQWLIIFLIILTAMISAQPVGLANPDSGGQDSDRNHDMGMELNGGSKGIGVGNEWGDPGVIHEGFKYVSKDELQKALVMFTDSSISLEDAVANLLMVIMKAMDQAIEKQAEKVEKAQGGKEEAATAGENPSVDMETMKLKRLTDKCYQLFDTFRQVIEKYDETAKSSIQSMRG